MFSLTSQELEVIMSPHIREGGYIVFGVDPVGVEVRFFVTFSCPHH